MTTNQDLTAEDLAEMLKHALLELGDADADDLPGELAELAETLQGARAETFGEGGWLTSNAGLVLNLPGGRRFQLTLVEA